MVHWRPTWTLRTGLSGAAAVAGLVVLVLLVGCLAVPWFRQETDSMVVQYWVTQVEVCVLYGADRVCTGHIPWAHASALDGRGLDIRIHAAVEKILVAANVCTDPASIVACLTKHAVAHYGFSPLTGYELRHTIRRVAALMGASLIYPLCTLGIVLAVVYVILDGMWIHISGTLERRLLVAGLAALTAGVVTATTIIMFAWAVHSVLAEVGSIEASIGTVAVACASALMMAMYRIDEVSLSSKLEL